MDKLGTETRPLSFTFARQADSSERLLISKLYNSLRPSKIDMFKESMVLCLTSLFSFILIAPFLLLGLYFLQKIVDLSFLSQNLVFGLFTLWMVSYTFYNYYKKYKSENGLLGQLSLLAQDHASGDIIEEAWNFIEAIAYHAPETDKRYYLVRADNNELVFFHEEGLLGRPRRANEEEFSAAPSDMILLRGKNSLRYIKGYVSGPTLKIAGHYTLRKEPPLHGALMPKDAYKYL